jgi:hypothetical protein
MKLREFKDKIRGSDNLDVVIVVDDDAWDVYDIEEGVNSAGRSELWIVAGEKVEDAS